VPHIVILYTVNLEADGHVAVLCRKLADTLLAQRDEAGAGVFPPGGTRVFAYPAAHHAVSDGGAAGLSAGGDGDYGFAYINLRMGRGRTDAVKQATGDALLAVAKHHFEPVLAHRRVGLTLQIDESPGQVYDGKGGNLHDLFRK
jgi:5-carboxymethyl-2-hydroxymuconate isomerase